jgi:nitrile hydratase accessory protein
MSQTAPRPEQPFEQPWHAAAVALTVHLHERGLFSWTEWADSLATALADNSKAGKLDGGDDY